MAEIVERRMVQEFPCYYDLHVPAAETPKPLIIALHGYGGDKSSMLRLMRNINTDDFVIAALQGPHQHMIIPKTPAEKLKIGFGWLTNYKAEESVELHHRNIRQIITTLTEDGIADPANIFLLGFSQAVGVNFRFAFTHANLLRGVIAICGGIPGDWQTEGKYSGDNLDVLYIGTDRDEFYTPERINNFVEALASRAHTVKLLTFDDEHKVPQASYSFINQWLKEKLLPVEQN